MSYNIPYFIHFKYIHILHRYLGCELCGSLNKNELNTIKRLIIKFSKKIEINDKTNLEELLGNIEKNLDELYMKYTTKERRTINQFVDCFKLDNIDDSEELIENPNNVKENKIEENKSTIKEYKKSNNTQEIKIIKSPIESIVNLAMKNKQTTINKKEENKEIISEEKVEIPEIPKDIPLPIEENPLPLEDNSIPTEKEMKTYYGVLYGKDTYQQRFVLCLINNIGQDLTAAEIGEKTNLTEKQIKNVYDKFDVRFKNTILKNIKISKKLIIIDGISKNKRSFCWIGENVLENKVNFSR